MASELHAEYLTGFTLYAVIENAAGQRWNTAGTPAFETHNAANWTDYDVALTEQTSSGTYIGTFPTGIATAGRYYATIYLRAGGSPAITDTKLASGIFDWTGTAEVVQTGDLFGGTPIDGYSVPNALRFIAAMAAGRVSGAGTVAEVFKGLDEATTRVTMTVDSSGNRSDVVYNNV